MPIHSPFRAHSPLVCDRIIKKSKSLKSRHSYRFNSTRISPIKVWKGPQTSTWSLSNEREKVEIAYVMSASLGSVWLKQWKSRRIENGEEIEKWEDRRDLVFSHLCLVERMKKWRDEKFICLVWKKNERMENEVGINL